MRLLKKFLAVVCVAGLAAMLAAFPAMADDDTGYQYTITISQGAGTSGSVTVKADYNDRLTLTGLTTITPPEGYYFVGFHEAGTDRDDLVDDVTVTRDTTYIATFAKEGNRATYTYTVHYVDRDTMEEIAEPTTGTGYANDTVLLEYKVIDNYMPLAYNERATLDQDGKVINFYYTDISQETRIVIRVVDGRTIYVYEEAEQPTNQAAGGNGTAAADGTAGGDAADGAGAADGGAGGADAADGGAGGDADQGADQGDGDEGEDVDTPDTPRDVIDVDDPDTPLDNNTIPTEGAGASLSTIAKVGIIAGVVVVAAVIIVIILLATKKKKKDKENN